MNNRGFTLLELMMSVGVLAIVSMMGLVAVMASASSAELSSVKDQVQASLRDTMMELSSEVREAYTQRTVSVVPPISPTGAAAISVNSSANSITFYVPVPTNDGNIVQASAPITIAFQNEDGTSGGATDAVLQSVEDANKDGLLTRRLVRTQGGATRVLGGANDLSSVVFTLVKNQNTKSTYMTSLQVTLVATKAYGPKLKRICREQLQSVIDLQN